MFTDQVSHRLSDGVEARADALYMSLNKGAVVDWYFGLPDAITGPTDGLIFVQSERPFVYKWPWKEAAKYLRHKPGNPSCGIGNSDLPQHYQMIECYPATWSLEEDDIVMNRIVAILVDDAQGFEILHWCVTELGG